MRIIIKLIFPLTEYVHVKEVPEIDSYISPSPSKRQQKNSNQSLMKHKQPKESKSQESRISRKNRKVPKVDYGDSSAYSSDISAKKTPKVIYEEFFGMKNPETKKYSKQTEKFSPTKKSPKEDSYLKVTKYYKLKKPKTASEFTSKNVDPYSYLPVSNWKLFRNSPEETITKSNVRKLSNSDDRTSFYGPSVLSGRVRSLTNAEILRDLTGI